MATQQQNHRQDPSHTQASDFLLASQLASQIKRDLSSTQGHSLEGLNSQGCIALSQGQKALAEDYFQQALASSPDDIDSLINMGFCQLSQNNVTGAEKVYHSLLQKTSNNDKAQLLQVYILLMQDKLEQALVPCRRLFRLYPEHGVIQRVFSEMCRCFTASSYLPELERDIIQLLELNRDYSEAIFPLAYSLLIHKFDLENEHAILDLQTLVQDPLLLALMRHCEINSPVLEELITAVRQNIFIEAMAVSQLPEQYQEFAIACGLQSANNGYIFAREDDESLEVQRLNLQIMQAVQSSFNIEDISAACLLVAMYEPLNKQPYSFHLLKYQERDWPNSLATLIHNALFKPLSLNDSLLCQNIDRPEFSKTPHWSINSKPTWHLAAPIASHRTLVITDGDSGYRAMQTASNQQDRVDVITHDPVEANYLSLQTSAYAMDNLRQLDKQQLELCHYDWVDSGLLLQKASRPHLMLASLKSYLNPSSILTVDCWADDLLEELQALRDFANSKDLEANIETIRALRKAVLGNREDSAWARLCHSPVFYDSHLLQQWVFSSHSGYTNQQLTALCQHNGLDFLGFVTASGINPGLGGQDKIRLAFRLSAELTQ